MEEATFSRVWQEIIKPEIDDFLIKSKERQKPFRRIENNDEKLRNYIHNEYKRNKDFLKNALGYTDDHKIDRHKIAALLYYAFVRNIDFHTRTEISPFLRADYQGDSESLKKTNRNVSHSLAFQMGLDIVKSFICDHPKSKESREYKDYIKKQGLNLPDLICKQEADHESYSDHIIAQFVQLQKYYDETFQVLDLSHNNDVTKIDNEMALSFILALAQVFFTVESYSKTMFLSRPAA